MQKKMQTPTMVEKSDIVTDPAALDPDPVADADAALPARLPLFLLAPVPVGEAAVVEGASEAKSVKIWELWYV